MTLQAFRTYQQPLLPLLQGNSNKFLIVLMLLLVTGLNPVLVAQAKSKKHVAPVTEIQYRIPLEPETVLDDNATQQSLNTQASTLIPIPQHGQYTAEENTEQGTTQANRNLLPEPGTQKAENTASDANNTNLYQPKGVNWVRKQVGLAPLSYEPLSGILILPVTRHGNDRLFSDLSMLFAREYAIELKKMTPQTKIYNPLLFKETLEKQKLGNLYRKVQEAYIKAGAPDPVSTRYLVSQLEESGKSISRVIFIDTEYDTGHPNQPVGVVQRVKKLLTDETVADMHGFVEARIQSFDTEQEDLPLVWRQSWKRPIEQSKFYNVTASVYDDADSELSMAAVSRKMSKELFLITPRSTYMSPVYDTTVTGKLAIPNDVEP